MVENTLEQELNQIISIKSIKVFDNAYNLLIIPLIHNAQTFLIISSFQNIWN